MKIPALSIRQPWVYCTTDLPADPKRIENRSWAPPVPVWGQRVALHASASLDSMDGRIAASRMAGVRLSNYADDMPLGAVVATAVVAGAITMDRGLLPALLRVGGIADIIQFDGRRAYVAVAPGYREQLTEAELARPQYTRWFVGPIGWIWADVEKLPEPVPATGRLGVWEWQR